MSGVEHESRDEEGDGKGEEEDVADGFAPVAARRLRDVVKDFGGLKEDVCRVVEEEDGGADACEVGEVGEYYQANGDEVV